MFFNFVIKNSKITNPQINKALLWDYDLSSLDFAAMRRVIVQRVIERGREEDFLAIFNLYGGIEGVRQIIRDEVLWLEPKDMSFASKTFGLKKEDLKCYIRAQSRAKLLKETS